MSNIEINDKNNWFFVVLLVAVILLAFIGIESCTTTKYYPYKITFTDGSVEYFELPYKVKKDSKSIEYKGETFFGVDSVELIK